MNATGKKRPAPDFRVVIPARYQSQRLPGKPLLELAGQPLIQRVYRNAARSGAGEVVVATDDRRIAECVEGFGGEVCLTSTEHTCGTDRAAEAAALRGWPDDAVVVNVQGDEPFLAPEDIAMAATLAADDDEAACATLAVRQTSPEEMQDPNKVKVVCDDAGFALYFSRSPIPAGEGEWLCHLGIYAYRHASLKRFTALPPCDLERREKLEQLRILWHGERIRVAIATLPQYLGIDTEKDLVKAAALIEQG